MAADVYSGYTKVPLEVLRHARDLCANFRIPPRQFRRRTSKGENGSYYPASDIVAVDVARAARDGMGGDDGYYATLLHELLHATGHQTRLGRATTGDYSAAGYALEEGTILAAQRILLRELGFGAEALEWYAPRKQGFPIHRRAASEAATWLLG
jgi:antirestriction protein ArdC